MKIRCATLLLSLIASAFISAGAMAQQTQPAKGPVKNIVLVHGAFVGGSGWRPGGRRSIPCISATLIGKTCSSHRNASRRCR